MAAGTLHVPVAKIFPLTTEQMFGSMWMYWNTVGSDDPAARTATATMMAAQTRPYGLACPDGPAGRDDPAEKDLK